MWILFLSVCIFTLFVIWLDFSFIIQIPILNFVSIVFIVFIISIIFIFIVGIIVFCPGGELILILSRLFQDSFIIQIFTLYRFTRGITLTFSGNSI